ncbi:uncharacterized protein LOC110765074 isoform X3 [Prunus avium]|uniref:Uncharacterized protein LOC110765074 isoform X3 n=1 Tax=Prunus avium TaxID=42229 RepID=A0A6P5T9J3_PRUAV|nr:uncharacterized protein LOC110765074 isoform X3 [Prunus avium]
MGDHSLSTAAFDRAVQQAIVSMKKGAYLLKYGQRRKPKFCPFRLSTDEKFLIWYSGKEERQLKLSSVTKIIPGQRSVSFRRQLEPERECQSFSLVYAHGERSLDLICKDEAQCEYWILGLRALISRCRHPRPLSSLGSFRQVQSCLNSPAGPLRRKQNLGVMDDATEFSQVRSVCASPTLSLSERCFSDGLSYSSDSFYSSERVLSSMQNVTDISVPNSPHIESDHLKRRRIYSDAGYEPHRFVSYAFGTSRIEKDNILKDVMIWGESIGGNLDSAVSRIIKNSGLHVDAVLPKLLESTMMLDVHNISLGGKHAAIVTKQGEVFCWGQADGGRLGNKINMDVSYPKLVDSLNGIQVKSVSCGEYQTCALTHSGKLYTWGDTSCGDSLAGKEKTRSQWLPQKLSGSLNSINISNVTCGEWHTAIVSTSGQLFTYGDGTFGVLGHGNLDSVSQPKEVESLKGLWVKSVSCGSWHTAAVVEIMVDRLGLNSIGGKLFTWGDADKGRLGHVDNERKLLPTFVARLVDHDFVQVCCGRMLTVGLTNKGTVYTMGSAAHGQLGNPQAKDKSITVVEGKLKEEFIREIASGSYHVAALTARGSVYTWGKGANGQLGLGDVDDRNTPTFVEALRDRQVESIVCGSDSTAAVCLHKSISVNDQSTCYGCNLPFGFIRKKHNCYNCGLLFCHACSSKKAMDASLAPKKGKAFRVCDPCFNNLQKLTHSCRSFKQENHSTKQLSTEEKAVPDRKEEKAGATPKYGHLLSIKQACNKENKSGMRNTMKNHGGDQQHLEPVSSFSSEVPRWGQVPCPDLFKPYCRENSTALDSLSKNNSSSVLSVHSDSALFSSTNAEKCISMSDEMLIEEIQRLRTEAISLQRKCQIGSHKIHECQQKIEETWSLAREEAATCKAAHEIIKALALRLNTMSEKVSAGRETNDVVAKIVPQLTPLNTNTSSRHLLPQVDSIPDTPIGFSDTPKSLYKRDTCLKKGRPEEDLHPAKTESQQRETKAVKLEWVEQYEPGVYITLVVLPSGQKGLKRVRFSRKKFADKDAERWWEANQGLVYQKYDIEEGYENSKEI